MCCFSMHRHKNIRVTLTHKSNIGDCSEQVFCSSFHLQNKTYIRKVNLVFMSPFVNHEVLAMSISLRVMQTDFNSFYTRESGSL